MKAKKFLAKALSALVACSFMTSCLSETNNEVVYSQSFLYFFNVIFEEGQTTPTYKNNVSYGYDCNYTNMTADITIQGLSLPGTSYTTVKLVQLPWTANNGWRNLTTSSINVSSESGAPQFNNFTFNVYDRNVSIYSQGSLVDIYYPLVKVGYQINNYEYTIVSLPNTVINEGTTTVTNQNNEIYQQSESRYFIQLTNSTSTDLNNEANRMAKLIIYDAQFDASMPPMNMVFDKIPFNVDNRGRITLKCDDLTPELLSASETTTPMPNFPITNLSGYTDSCNNMYLTFVCTMAQTGAVYNVMVECQQPN